MTRLQEIEAREKAATPEADDSEADYDDDPADECGLNDDGQCMLAGTEWCDFECPMRDSEMFAGSTAWNRKHGRKKT